MFEPKNEAKEREERLRDEETTIIWSSRLGMPDALDREIEISGETRKTLMRISRVREDLESIEGHLDFIDARVCRGEVPEILIMQIRDKLDALESIVESRGWVADDIVEKYAARP